jgi:hypothetical protein
MAFGTFKQGTHRRMWALIGEATTGKSTFLAACRDPLVVIDPDGRFLDLAQEMQAQGRDALSLSNKPADHHDALAIQKALEANMPKANVATIGLDSMTALLEPLVARIMEEIERGLHTNKAAAWQPKSRLLRLIVPAMTKWGTDVIFIYHEQDHRDHKGQEGVRRTVSALEEARMLMNLNARIKLGFVDGGERYAEVIWSRTGRTGKVFDAQGMWEGVPEQIDALIWDDLTETEKEVASGVAPATFADPQAAWAWGFAQGPFRDMRHAQNAYEKVKTDEQPKNAKAMRDLWVADVERRVGEAAEGVPEEEEVKAFQAPDGTVYACPDCDEPVPDDGTNKLLTCGNCGVVFNPDAEPEAPPAEEEAPVEEPF